MVPQLPEEFLKRMEKLLGREEYVEFLDNYGKERRQALRVNTAKISVEEFQKQSPFSLEPVPWANQGFYYGGGSGRCKAGGAGIRPVCGSRRQDHSAGGGHEGERPFGSQ